MLRENSIYWGDCLQVMNGIDDESIDMVLVDLPYGMTARNKWDVPIPFEAMWLQVLRVIKLNGAMVFTAMQPFTSMLILSNRKYYKYEWIYQKSCGTGHLNAKKQPLRAHEQIIIFYKKQCIYHPQMTEGKPYKLSVSNKKSTNYGEYNDHTTVNVTGQRYPISVQRFNRPRHTLHPTQKPLALFEYMIRTYTNPNELVLDFCAGSGTTGLACQNLGRKFILIEKVLKYCRIARKRIKGTTHILKWLGTY